MHQEIQKRCAEVSVSHKMFAHKASAKRANALEKKNLIYIVFFLQSLTTTIFSRLISVSKKCLKFWKFTGTYGRLAILWSKQRLKIGQNWLSKCGLINWIGWQVVASESAKDCWQFRSSLRQGVPGWPTSVFEIKFW